MNHGTLSKHEEQVVGSIESSRSRVKKIANYSPVGTKIVWFTSVWNNNRGTDYWSMNYDGSEKQRLTDFNNPRNASYQGKVITAADFSFSPDGKRLVAHLFTSLLAQKGMTVVIDLEDRWYE